MQARRMMAASSVRDPPSVIWLSRCLYFCARLQVQHILVAESGDVQSSGAVVAAATHKLSRLKVCSLGSRRPLWPFKPALTWPTCRAPKRGMAESN